MASGRMVARRAWTTGVTCQYRTFANDTVLACLCTASLVQTSPRVRSSAAHQALQIE